MFLRDPLGFVHAGMPNNAYQSRRCVRGDRDSLGSGGARYVSGMGPTFSTLRSPCSRFGKAPTARYGAGAGSHWLSSSLRPPVVNVPTFVGVETGRGTPFNWECTVMWASPV